jgi:23S rRNA (uracil1939-C5)-methyltransferase
VAPRAKFVWGVEVNKDIVDLAWQNAQANNINNISFFVNDVRRFLNTQGAFYKDIEVLVVNPPRSGLSHKIIRGILRLKPQRIIYSSCNPQALFRDLEALCASYDLKFVEPFDFFPHTPHLECLAFLRSK